MGSEVDREAEGFDPAASSGPAASARVTTRGLLSARGSILLGVAVWYQVAVVFAITPLAALFSWLALAALGSPAVVNTALVRLLVSPVSLGALAAGELVAIAGSCLLGGASSIAVLEAAPHALDAFGRAIRRLVGLVAIVLSAIWCAALWALPPVVVAVAAYVLTCGVANPIDAFARNPVAVIATGSALVLALAALWSFLFVRWLFAIPLHIAENTPGREALARSWELTRGRWLGLGLRLAGLQVAVAIVGSIPLMAVNAGAVWMAGTGIGLALALAIALYSAGAVALSVVLALSFEAFIVSAFLTASGRAVPVAEPVTSSSSRARWIPVIALGAAAVGTGLLGVGGAWTLLQQPVDVSHIEIIAHRAGATYAPENSLSAVKQARADHASRIEFDVRRTADGKLVVGHDADLMRVSGQKVSIGGSTLAEIERVDIGSTFATAFAGERVPTLERFLDATGDTPLALEIKTAKAARTTTREAVALLKARGDIGRTVLISLDPQLTALARSLDPSLRVGDLVSISAGRTYMLPAEVIAPENALVNSQFVSAAHAQGKQVWVWTLDDESSAREAALRGVDGIITNDVPGTRRALDSLANLTAEQVARQRVSDLIGE